jgi:sigma-B regulation protein RsbU (phosphoserine phosphatase)
MRTGRPAVPMSRGGRAEPPCPPLSKALSEPLRDAPPEPFREPLRDPHSEQVPEPFRDASPEQVREPVREPLPEQVREPLPQPPEESFPRRLCEPSPGALAGPAEEDLAELYENAPCGHVSTLPDGRIAKINNTLLGRLGHRREELTGRRRFADLLAVGDRIYYETHLAPLLHMQGHISGIALELRAADGSTLPVLLTSRVKPGADGRPALIRHTVFDAADRRSYERELLRARQDAEQEQKRLRQLVSGLQASLLPAALPSPPGLETAAHYHMASPDEVGGDFYDLFRLPGGRWGFFLGDVCGKGVPAAAATATARYTLRAAAVYDPDPAAVLANLNTVLLHEYASDRHRHCTVAFGILAPEPGGWVATIAGGGHPAPVVLRDGGSVQYQPTTGGTLIGILPRPRIVTRTVHLGAGDMLILYTDGLTEARTGPGRRRYGSDALLAFVGDLAPCSADGAIVELTRLVESFPDDLDDDVAFMAIRVAGR